MTAVTQSEFAKRMGYAKSTVTKMKQEGRLVMTDGGLVDIDASVARIDALASPSAHHRAHAQQLQEERDAKQSGVNPEQPAPEEGIEALNLRLKKAEANKREHEADIARMDREIKAGNLLAREDVDFVLNDYGATLRGLMENLADRLAPTIAPLQTLEETHAALSEAAESLLGAMHHAMQQKAQEHST